MNKKLLRLLEAQLSIAPDDIKSDLENIIKFYKNGTEAIKAVVKKTVEAVSNFFTSDGKIEIAEESISFTKKEIIDFFKSGNEKQPFLHYDGRFAKGLNECLADYRDDEIITFPKSELEFFKNINSKSIGDEKAIELLNEKILDMKVKEDRVELLKRYAVVMYHLKNQPFGEEGTFQNNGYAIIFGWIKFVSGEWASLCFDWRSSNRLWRLNAYGLDIKWDYGRCFFSRKMLVDLGS